MDDIMMFKVLILQALYNLSDDAVKDRVPDTKTVWLYRKALNQDGTAKALFGSFDNDLKGQGHLAMSGQIADATIGPVPKNRNTEKENAAIKAMPSIRRLRGHIHRKRVRGRTLTAHEQQGNTTKSEVRARVEHVFGTFVNDMGGKLVRTIGIVRAHTKIGMQNLTYNMKRHVFLERTQEATAA